MKVLHDTTVLAMAKYYQEWLREFQCARLRMILHRGRGGAFRQ